MVRFAEGLTARGIDVLTFNFGYADRGSRRPDPNDALEACWMEELAYARTKLAGRALFLGGKSMGGRIASQIAARDDVGELAGLVLLGYPLHPPGDKKKLRTQHLPSVRAPMLFVQGARDAFGTPRELARVLKKVQAETEIFPIAGGDHSFVVPKRAGVPQERVYETAMDAIERFTRR
jgi:predicted alpha/beta-hydrolase family hydrolase